MKQVKLYLEYQNETYRFGADYLIDKARRAGIRVLMSGLSEAPVIPGQDVIVARPAPNRVSHGEVSEEEYEIIASPKGGWTLQSLGSPSSLMYALMDVGDIIARHGMEGIQPIRFKPSIEKRGIKFNLPYEPYAEGSVTVNNRETCMSFDFWRDYLDMLARNRYNFLSLWSEHPFHLMVKLTKYPETCPYDDYQMSRYQQLFHFIFRHAHARGIKVAIITWNIRIPEFATRGLGLPYELGNSYPNPVGLAEVKRRPNVSQHFAKMDGARQAQPLIQDYIKECVKTMLLTYSEIDMIGTNCAEEMVGDMYERQQWVEEAYLGALKESGRTIPFIMRTNIGSCALAEEFLERCPGKTNYISWKYSVAHMYSSEEPQFESLQNIWAGIKHPEKLNALFTVRNDDFHTLRWGDADFIRKYLKGIAAKSYCRGFYWGADGYLYGSDFAHHDHGHKVWQYDFEKHWMEFSLLGRLSYNVDAEEDNWRDDYVEHYGEHGSELYDALKLASRMMPPVNRLHWLDIDVRWHPETLLSMFGFRSVIDTLCTRAMPGSGTIGLRAFARAEYEGQKADGETPLAVIDTLRSIADTLADKLEEISRWDLIGEGDCLREDLYCWQALSEFYVHRFTSALELARLEVSGDESHRAAALEAALAEREPWTRLAAHWASHYTNYMKARGAMMTGYWLYLKDVERDAELVEGFGLVPLDTNDPWTLSHVDIRV